MVKHYPPLPTTPQRHQAINSLLRFSSRVVASWEGPQAHLLTVPTLSRGLERGRPGFRSGARDSRPSHLLPARCFFFVTSCMWLPDPSVDCLNEPRRCSSQARRPTLLVSGKQKQFGEIRAVSLPGVPHSSLCSQAPQARSAGPSCHTQSHPPRRFIKIFVFKFDF